MSDSALARAELVVRLTPIAPVRTGRAALETTSATLPVIVLWSTGDQPSPDQGYAAPLYTRQLSLEYKTTASAAYDDDLDAALSAIRAALKPALGASLLPHAIALRETSARFFAPDISDTGASRIAVLQITFEIDYLERF
ncbi:MAG TPA: hypothetical protein PLC99_22425 [Verrucomicrobiota bacterium]|nr:hypothetical protein [Verrucomicrobiota bacterium]